MRTLRVDSFNLVTALTTMVVSFSIAAATAESNPAFVDPKFPVAPTERPET